MKRLGLALAAAWMLSGCATIVGSETQDVTLQTQPPGVKFVVQDETGRAVAEGFTPKTVTLAKSTGNYFGKKKYLVMLERPGYVPQTLPLKESANLWYLLGNVPLLGFPGWLLVDPFYGGMYKIEPERLDTIMNPVGARGG
ncbi:hypothetical protein GKQ23_06445 [Erwinia sp. E602]|uniref:hypothetical protein n=1 Tax=unclassified Erwinia TaxID=2622719 RepID=UPI0006F5E5D7|nr:MULTISPECIES: hypothetical protein [unclassified Erwinia]KQN54792.1 hypothetical protein ASF13_10100 [Erwinia sp. Leaf53]PLV57728.1 hypothetical protein NV64_15560 [Erwinia sp. B116]QUG74656.1 hypothetical protein GKQ23_06445 [Erwinia sp. E602]